MVNRPQELAGNFAIADEDIAGYEFGRSHAHQITNPGWLPMGLEYHALDAEAHWDLVERGDVATDIFLDDPTARTATLGILRLRGDWDAAAAMQEEIIGPGSTLRQPPYNGIELAKSDENAKRTITLDWGIVSVGGLAMVATQRRILQTPWVNETVHAKEHSRIYEAYSSFEVDRRSTFALDIPKLADLDPSAAREVRLIIICGMIATRDWSRLERAVTGNKSVEDYRDDGPSRVTTEMHSIMYARNKMRQYGISADEVMERAFGETPTRARHPATLQAIEDEIKEPAGLLIPSTVTFYGERTLHKLERV